MGEIVVLGSLNMDLVVNIERMPMAGETLRGSDLLTTPGGKGANQAAAVALLGTSVSMIGRVGADIYGSLLINNLRNFGVDTSGIMTDPAASTGTAMILIDRHGENSIVISPGANGKVSIIDVDHNAERISKAKLLLLQLEIPLETIIHAIEIAHQSRVPVIFNPAPAAEVPKEIFEKIDILIPNEIEAHFLTGIEIHDQNSAATAAHQLLAYGAKKVIITLGHKGSIMAVNHESIHIPARPVDPIDTTAAGDAFIGCLASAIAKGHSLEDSVHYASCAGALAVTRKGAQTSLPTADEVNRFYAASRA